jgi:flagella basal body P-ring formation protein FlgA
MRRLGIGLVIGLAGLAGFASTAMADDVQREGLAVQAHVADRLAIPVEDVEVIHLGLVQGLSCGPEAIFSVSSSPGETFRRHADLRITGMEHEQECGSARVRASLRVWMTVPVAKVQTRAGDGVVLSKARLSLDEIDGNPVQVDSGTWEARVDLAAGEAVTTNRVRRMPDSRSGEVVLIEAGSGALRVTANGRLLQNGRVGDVVRVSNLATDQVVQGVLVEPGKVRAGGEG